MIQRTEDEVLPNWAGPLFLPVGRLVLPLTLEAVRGIIIKYPNSCCEIRRKGREEVL